jgi:sigma-B regulation protein RsbU (phosphoserine phosphatase)
MASGFRTSIRLKLAVFVGLVVILTAAALSFASYHFAHRTLSNEIHQRLTLVSAGRRQMLQDYVRQQEERAQAVASRTRLRELLADHMAGRVDLAEFLTATERILRDAQQGIHGAKAIWVVDAQGQVLTATDETLLGERFAESVEFSEGRKAAVVGDLRERDGQYEVTLAAPALVASQLVGVVMLRVDAAALLKELADPVGLGETGEVLVAKRVGDKIRYLVPARSGRPIGDVTPAEAPAMAAAIAGDAGFQRVRDYRGVDVLAAHAPVGPRGWGMVAKMDAVEAYAPIAWLRRLFIIVEVTALAVGLLASYAVARRFTNPVLRMAKMAEAIAGGDLDARVVVETNDELGVLARAFNRMTEEVGHSHALLEERVRERTADLARLNEALQAEVAERKQAEQVLAQQQDLLQSLMDKIPDHIYFKDEHSRFIRVNQAMAEWSGLRSPAEMIGKTDFHIFSKEHAQEAYDDEQAVMRTGEPVVGKEEKETWPDGRVTWASTTKMPLRDKTGRIIGTFGMSRDVTERKNAERQLAQYAAALTRKTAQTQEDLNLAREIQLAFLPARYPTFPAGVAAHQSALQFRHRYQPASTLGGDFFDVIPLSDTTAGVLICDVMGHGMRAALVTAILRGLVNELRPWAIEPGEFLTEINRALLKNLKSVSTPIFASAFYGVLDAATGELEYANAGHPHPLVLRPRAGTVESVRVAGQTSDPALGLFADSVYAARRSALEVGDSLLLFTDGLYEVLGVEGEPLGLDRLLAAVRERLAVPGEQRLDELIATAQQFAVNGEFSDDVCLVSAELVAMIATVDRTPRW